MLYTEFRRKLRKGAVIGLLVLFAGILSCATNKMAKEDASALDEVTEPSESKTISDISTSQDTASISVYIKGSSLLTYTSVKQPQPLGLVLYFPDTSLGISQAEYEVDSDVVGTIKASELIEGGPSKITIAMKTDVEYQIAREGDSLKISFDRPEAPQEEGVEASTAEEAALDNTPSETETSAGVAVAGTATLAAAADSEAAENVFHAISTDPQGDRINILVQLDREVKKYKSFSLPNPARIVADLYDIKSEFKGQQVIPVDSQYVKQIRHFAYPEKLRVVLETEEAYLSSFSANPTGEGLLIQVGDVEPEAAPVEKTDAPSGESDMSEAVEPQTSEAAPVLAAAGVVAVAAGEDGAPAEPEEPIDAPVETEAVSEEFGADESVAPETEAVPEEAEAVPEVAAAGVVAAGAQSYPAGPAFVNRVDFLSKENGKSSIIVGTTKPVTYSLDTDDKRFRLDLMNTKIMNYRQRPLITTRFESAVDRIIPVQTPKMKDNARIVVELREDVPYTVEQTGNQIQIDFEASSIPPKPFEEAELPPWTNVMEEEAVLAETKIAMTVVGASELDAVEPEPVEPLGPVESEAPLEIDEPEMVEDEMVETEEMVSIQEVPEVEMGEERVQSVPREVFSGEKIALDFYQTDIKNVLRILRDVSGKNFAIDKDVSGKVTLTLVKPVPWDQVLDLILRMNQLGQLSEGNIVRIVTISTLRKEEKMRSEALKAAQAIKEQEKALEPLITEYIPINYASAAADIKPRLEEIKTPKRGKVGVDRRNNQIIMTDVVEKIAKAKEIIRRIDKVTPEVIIEARVIEVSENFSRAIGTEWGLDYGPVSGGDGAEHTYKIAMNHPVAASGTIGYQFARIAGTPISLNAQLQAIEATGNGKIVSTPKIVTLDNKQATISQGLEYPYLERDSSGLATVKFKKIDLKLDVTPHVTPDNRISMKINITKNDVDDIVGGIPSLATNSASTELLVNNGDTIVIGGIIKITDSEGYSQFPLLSQIPILGWLFKSKTTTNKKNELLIFITPTIVHLETQV